MFNVAIFDILYPVITRWYCTRSKLVTSSTIGQVPLFRTVANKS